MAHLRRFSVAALVGVLVAAGLWFRGSMPEPPAPPPPPSVAARARPISPEFENVRKAPQPSAAAASVARLAESIRLLEPDDPERLEMLRVLFERAGEPEQSAFRLYVQRPLEMMELSRRELEQLIALAASDEPEIRMWCLRILSGRWDQDRSLRPVLLGICRTCARDTHDKVREYASRALAGGPDEQIRPLLLKLSADAAWNVRLAAAGVLAGTAGAERRLQVMADADTDTRVREAARRALTVRRRVPR